MQLGRSNGCGQNQLVEMGEIGEMREMEEMRENILPHLPHLPYLHSSQKDQLLMTTPEVTDEFPR